MEPGGESKTAVVHRCGDGAGGTRSGAVERATEKQSSFHLDAAGNENDMMSDMHNIEKTYVRRE